MTRPRTTMTPWEFMAIMAIVLFCLGVFFKWLGWW